MGKPNINTLKAHAERLLKQAERVIRAIDAGEMPNPTIPMPDGSSVTLRDTQQDTVRTSQQIIEKLEGLAGSDR